MKTTCASTLKEQNSPQIPQSKYYMTVMEEHIKSRRIETVFLRKDRNATTNKEMQIGKRTNINNQWYADSNKQLQHSKTRRIHQRKNKDQQAQP